MNGPFNRFESITPAAGDLPRYRQTQQLTDALYVGSGGDLSVVLADQRVQILRAVSAGALLALGVRAVSVGTSAGNLVALYQI